MKINEGPEAAKLCNYLFTCYPSPAQGFPSTIGIRKLFVGDDQTKEMNKVEGLEELKIKIDQALQ